MTTRVYRRRTRASSLANTVSSAAIVLIVAGCGGGEGDPATREPAASIPAASTPGTPAAAATTKTVSEALHASDATAGAVALPETSVAEPWSTIARTSARVDDDVLEDWPEARFAGLGRVPAAPQRPGDPVAGRRALVEEGYVACGLPARVVEELVAGEDIVTLPDREPAAAALPFSMNVWEHASGVPVASSNCLACHGTPLFGELVIGLGNEFLDFTANPSIAVERAGALVRGPDETALWERYADRVNAIAPYMTMATVGTNPANNLTFALIAHRDPVTAAWSEEPLLPMPSADPPPVSVPPWWRMAKKHAMFNLGEGRGDHGRIMMAASMLCTDSIAELEVIDEYAPDIRAYIESLEPPAWPFEIDEPLTARGRDVFEENCSLCHGRYATDADGRRVREDDVYPNRLVPIELVDSDPTLVAQAHTIGLPYLDWFNRSFYGELSTAAPGAGYVAPPLDGIWATGPFLHNGSVPSVRALLDSGTRPVRWRSLAQDASDPATYDRRDLGWRFEAGDGIAADVAETRVYDARRPGHANSGHRFGDHLSEAERSAVIEYLKTL